MSERTLVLIKPDAVRRGLIGAILARFEHKGLAIERLELRTLTRETAETHYGEHRDKSFYSDLVDFITSGPLVAMVVAGEGAVAHVRALMGATKPAEAAPGTIRGDHATAITENLVHGSDSPDSAAREIALFFGDA